MKLYIAEKPSLGKAIAAGLPKPHKNHKTHIEVGNGDMVTWCIGHILEQSPPEKYDEKLKKWQLDTLPIVPESWQLQPKYKTRAQLSTIRRLSKQAKEIIHAGDPDREGQLLVDEVLDYINTPKQKLDNCKRLLISDLNLSAVKKALNSLKSNKSFQPLSVSALARARADWLYGINLTRAYTLFGQKAGYHDVLSVGRVQTPILGLIVKRDKDIEAFTSHNYYEVIAHLTTEEGETFTAKWQPSEACQPYQDEEGRIVVKKLAENVVSRIANQEAVVLQVEEKERTLRQPLPFNLSTLQIEAAKIFSMNAKLVLDTCQRLYETHKLITYPRSDCRYLPKEHLNQAKTIVGNIGTYDKKLEAAAKKADLNIKSHAWNDKKVSAHHAIIPTEKPANNCNLNTFEKNIYWLIARQYLAQFFPIHMFNETRAEIEIAGGKFVAKAKQPKQLGWKELFKSNKAEKEETLPELMPKQQLHCQSGELQEKETQPPKPFTDASLLSALTGIARFVQDASLKNILKETDGLGTEATRAGIIDLLFKRNFLTRTGKAIHATEIGRALINSLPPEMTLPDMTAHWELQLNNISEKKQNYSSFMSPLVGRIEQLINHGYQCDLSALPQKKFTPKRKRRYKKSGQK